MRCHACSTSNPSGRTDCEACGALLVAACGSCGYQNVPTANFCGGCGSSLARGRTLDPHNGSRPDLASGERKHVTVLFADVVNSTQLIAELDPEQAMERLRPAVAAMCEQVERFDGTVIRTMGDGILALFGAPRAQEGHALLACQAALAIQAAFPKRDTGLSVRVGLHSGDVVSDMLVSDPKGQAAHGVAIHLASRVEQMAEPGGICLTDECYRLVRFYCDARSIGPHMAKGLSSPVLIHRLLGLKPAVASQPFRGTILTPFRGRDHELALLQRALSDADSPTRVIGISAPPGVGKSRLCYEFTEWCRRCSIPVLEARALIYGHAMPLQPVLELFRLFFRISAADDNNAARQRIAERLLAIDPSFEPDLPILNDFLGVHDGGGLAPRLDPKARQARLRQIIRRLARQVGVAPSVIIIEDLHWLDEASGDFVETLVDSIIDTKTLLVLNYRPSYAARWRNSPYYHEVSLPELSSEQTKVMVDELVGTCADLRDIRERISERSGGNPFFAEELVRSLAENAVLVGQPGNYVPGTKITQVALPTTVQAVIGARVDRLSADAKAILQIGAIIGKDFPVLVLEQIIGFEADHLGRTLESLCEAELIQEQMGAENRSFAFRHPLIQEVVYTTQLKARRTELHAVVAKAMEDFHKDRIAEFAGLIAYHWEAAGQLFPAARYTSQAAMWVGKTNSAQGLRNWEKVRSLLNNQASTKTSDTLRALACGQIMNFGWREGMTPERAKPFSDEAFSLARDAGDTTMQTYILAAYGRICGATGAADEYVSSIKAALSLISGEGQIGRNATLNAILSQANTFAGLLNEALAANTIALEGAASIESTDYRVLGFNVEHWIMCLRGKILVLLGRFGEAEEWLRRMLQIEGRSLDPVVHYIPHAAYVDLAWYRGDAFLADQHSSRVTAIAERSAIPYLQVHALACAGVANGISGNFEGAVDYLTRALNFARYSKVGLEYEARMVADLAEGHYLARNLKQAVIVAKQAIEIAQRRTARFAECHASLICAAALISQRGVEREEAEALLRRAEALIAVSGARIYEPMLARENARLTRC